MRLDAALTRAAGQQVRAARDKLDSLSKLLTALSYEDVLQRGFALVRHDDGTPLHDKAAVAGAGHVMIELRDGSLGATVDDADAKPSATKPANRKRKSSDKPSDKPSGQQSLF